MIMARTNVTVGVDHRGENLVLIAAIMGSITFVLFLIRFQQRYKYRHKRSWDDLAVMFAMVFCILLCVTACVDVYYGYGLSSDNLSSRSVYIAAVLFYAQQIFYKLTLIGAKMTYLCMGFRLFPCINNGIPNKSVRYQVVILMYIVCLSGLATVLVTIFQCRPFQKIFDPSIEGNCIDLKKFWYGNAGINIVTDLAMLAVPWPHILRWKVSKWEKCGIGMMLGLGIFVTVISFNRIHQLKTSGSQDFAFSTLNATIWTIIEANAAIICVTLPAWKTMLNTILPKCFPGDGQNTTSSAHAGGHPSSSGSYVMNNISQGSSRPLISTPAPVVQRHLSRPESQRKPVKSSLKSSLRSGGEEALLEVDGHRLERDRARIVSKTRMANQEYVRK